MTDKHTTVQYQLRLPEGLRDRVKSSAEKKNRSMNADIVARLEQSFLKDFHSANTGFPVLLAAIIDFLPRDGRYTEQEASDFSTRLIQHMTNPDFLKSYFNTVSDYDDLKGLNPLADDK